MDQEDLKTYTAAITVLVVTIGVVTHCYCFVVVLVGAHDLQALRVCGSSRKYWTYLGWGRDRCEEKFDGLGNTGVLIGSCSECEIPSLSGGVATISTQDGCLQDGNTGKGNKFMRSHAAFSYSSVASSTICMSRISCNRPCFLTKYVARFLPSGHLSIPSGLFPTISSARTTPKLLQRRTRTTLGLVSGLSGKGVYEVRSVPLCISVMGNEIIMPEEEQSLLTLLKET
nr:hypothetical protein [Tanacetum cinerariifolium]